MLNVWCFVVVCCKLQWSVKDNQARDVSLHLEFAYVTSNVPNRRIVQPIGWRTEEEATPIMFTVLKAVPLLTIRHTVAVVTLLSQKIFDDDPWGT